MVNRHEVQRLAKAINAGRRVLVTGAGGSIGSSLARAILAHEPSLLILLDHSEHNLYQIEMELAAKPCPANRTFILGDICDRGLLTDIFENYHPDIVYHAAAFKHVPLLENNPFAAIRNNAIGTYILAMAAGEHEADLIMISTDKAANPHSVMGASKRVAELALLRWGNSKSRLRALRLGNVLGSRGSVVPLFRDQISRGGPVTVTHREVSRFALSIGDAVQLIFATAEVESPAGIFVPEMGEPVKILRLARDLIAAAGLRPEVDIPVAFTGLRPGDKMEEELFGEGELAEPSGDPRLRQVRASIVAIDQFDSDIAELAKIAEARNSAKLLEVVRRMVPNYRPSESMLRSLNCLAVIAKT